MKEKPVFDDDQGVTHEWTMDLVPCELARYGCSDPRKAHFMQCRRCGCRRYGPWTEQSAAPRHFFTYEHGGVHPHELVPLCNGSPGEGRRAGTVKVCGRCGHFVEGASCLKHPGEVPHELQGCFDEKEGE